MPEAPPLPAQRSLIVLPEIQWVLGNAFEPLKNILVRCRKH